MSQIFPIFCTSKRCDVFVVESEENHPCRNNRDGGCLLDTVANSEKILTVVKDTGDHVLKLAFMDLSPQNETLLTSHRYVI